MKYILLFSNVNYGIFRIQASAAAFAGGPHGPLYSFVIPRGMIRFWDPSHIL